MNGLRTALDSSSATGAPSRFSVRHEVIIGTDCELVSLNPHLPRAS